MDDDWYLRAWLAHFGKRQSSLVTELGWDKAGANHVFHSKRPYRRDYVNEIAGWLGLRQYELFMHPSEALALRDFRRAAEAIAIESGALPRPSPDRTARSSVERTSQALTVEIGARIREARLARRWSQALLAHSIYQAQTTVSSWERGRTEPTRADVLKIAKVLGVDAAELEGR